MRLDHDGPQSTLVLSERNLLALLSKLYTEDSACQLEGGLACPMSVRAEPDVVHYAHAGREGEPPGPMHPVTEQIIALLRAQDLHINRGEVDSAAQ